MIHANQPIRTVEDIKDLKIHVQTRFAGEALQVARRAARADAGWGSFRSRSISTSSTAVVDPWHMMPALRLNDLLKTHTEFSELLAEQHDIRAGDEQRGL